MKPFLRCLGVNDYDLYQSFKECIYTAELWSFFDNFFSTAHENLFTINNNMDIVPKNITNDDGDGGEIVVGKFNGVDIKTTKEAIILEMNGGVGNKDDE